MKTKSLVSCLIVSALLALTGCDYYVPITAVPTREIETTLVGDWTGPDGTDEDCENRMMVGKYDSSTYVVAYDGKLFRAWHSDVDSTPFLTVESLDGSEPRFSYFAWSLSEGGTRLTLRPVRKFAADEMRDPATVVKALQANAGKSDLFGENGEFKRRY